MKSSTGRRSLPAEARSSGSPTPSATTPSSSLATGATSAANELSVFYNASVLNVPSPEDVRVLGLRYLVVPASVAPVAGRVVEEADGYSLWELHDSQPLSTVTSMVEFVDDLSSAMDEVTTSGFDRRRR